MDDLAARLKKHPNIGLRRTNKTWVIEIPKPPDLLFRLTVLLGTLAWSAEAILVPAGRSIWSDWSDYQPLGNEQATDLLKAIAGDVDRFVGQLLDAPVRQASTAAGGAVEWNMDGEWRPIQLP